LIYVDDDEWISVPVHMSRSKTTKAYDMLLTLKVDYDVVSI